MIRNQPRPLRVAIRTNGSDLDVVDEIFVRGAYYMGITGIKTVLDLGGNTGLASIYLHIAFPEAKLACVEPVPANIQILRRNIEMNRVPVSLFEAAVGSEDGTIQFDVSPDPRLGCVSSAGAPDVKPMETITVKVISVTTILNELGWDHIDLLKLDIEGGERELLAGNPDWLRRVGVIVGEGHHGYGVNYTAENLAEQLRPFGFRINLLEQRSGSFVFVADSDPVRSLKLPERLATECGPIFGL